MCDLSFLLTTLPAKDSVLIRGLSPSSMVARSRERIPTRRLGGLVSETSTVKQRHRFSRLSGLCPQGPVFTTGPVRKITLAP